MIREWAGTILHACAKTIIIQPHHNKISPRVSAVYNLVQIICTIYMFCVFLLEIIVNIVGVSYYKVHLIVREIVK